MIVILNLQSLPGEMHTDNLLDKLLECYSLALLGKKLVLHT